jgi:hypothetical protein
VLANLRANKKQIESSDSQIKDQIDASNKQLKEQIEASDLQVHKQIEESRRLATENHQQQSRPILAPQKEVFGDAITYFSPESGKASETLYASDGRIDWSWQHPIGIKIHNMGNGPAFNIHAILYGNEDTNQSQFVSWDNGPIEEKASGNVRLTHSSLLQLFHSDSVDGEHPLYDRSLDSPTNPWEYRAACLTITYHDLFRKKYVSIFHYTLQHQWIHVATEEITEEPPLDLKELNAQKKLQGPKLSAPPIKTV